MSTSAPNVGQFPQMPPRPPIGSQQTYRPPVAGGRPPTLDATGTQAAIYPSELQLWQQGPWITDPGGQGVTHIGAQTFMGPPPIPSGAAGVEIEEGWIHDQLNGPTPSGAPDMWWVNPENYGVPGLGDWNMTVADSPASAMPYSGHDANVVSNPSAEQGWGVGPARRWARYPKVDSPNPFRNGAYLRNGDLPWVVADSYLYERSQLAWQAQWQPYKFRSAVAPTVPVPGAVPFSYVVPTYAGGPAPIPALDIPAVGQQPVYPTAADVGQDVFPQ